MGLTYGYIQIMVTTVKFKGPRFEDPCKVPTGLHMVERTCV